jgi:DNA-binding NtrC family response regulator
MLEMEDGGGWDVVLLDLDSPGSEGIKGLRQIRRRWAEVPVLVATRDNSVEMGKQIVQEQVFFYSVKPVNVWEIGTILEAAWSRAARLGGSF